MPFAASASMAELTLSRCRRRDPPGAGDGPAAPHRDRQAFGDVRQVHRRKDVSLSFAANRVHALIGPSGCGKSTFLRTLNRMHELSDHGWITGRVLLDGEDIYGPRVNVDAAAAPGRHGLSAAHAVSHHVDL